MSSVKPELRTCVLSVAGTEVALLLVASGVAHLIHYDLPWDWLAFVLPRSEWLSALYILAGLGVALLTRRTAKRTYAWVHPARGFRVLYLTCVLTVLFVVDPFVKQAVGVPKAFFGLYVGGQALPAALGVGFWILASSGWTMVLRNRPVAVATAGAPPASS